MRKEIINHLLFMDDLKLYAAKKDQLDQFTVQKVPHNTGAISSFQLRLKSGDIHPIPGPAKRKTVKYPCVECLCNVRNNQDAILCGECQRWFHAKCINMGKAKKTILRIIASPGLVFSAPYRSSVILSSTNRAVILIS